MSWTLTKAGARLEVKKASTHAGATILALRKLKKAEFPQILAEVKRQRKIQTEMELDKAVRWILFDLKRRGLTSNR